MTTSTPEAGRPGRRPKRAPDGRMPLLAHLRELRNRVFLASAGIVLGAVAGWILYPTLFAALQAPVRDLAAARG